MHRCTSVVDARLLVATSSSSRSQVPEPRLAAVDQVAWATALSILLALAAPLKLELLQLSGYLEHVHSGQVAEPV